MTGIRLTEYTHALGCACKIRPQLLEKILKGLPFHHDPAILVGHQTSDDAAVYRIDEHTAIVQTVDFIPPVVDDPYMYGAIAAANALSDVFAMGAKPLFALSIVGFPDRKLPLEVLQEILRGAGDKAAERQVSRSLAGTASKIPNRNSGWSLQGSFIPTGSCAIRVPCRAMR